MAKIREEIVGKRFLCVSKSCKLKLSKIAEWDWRSGVIRACTHTDSKHPDLQVLVEYDDVSWQRREWVHVYRDEAFQLLLIEHTLFWTSSKGVGNKLKSASGVTSFLWPVLTFEPLIDEVGLFESKGCPVEHLLDRSLEFQDYSHLQPYQEEIPPNLDPESEEYVRQWVADQDGQRILCTTPSVLVGFRVQVYRSEGTTQWYTAVIVRYNDATRELTVTDDTVLEEHSEDPSLVHIRLLGEGVVESILRGENVGITPRRSRSSSNNHNHYYHQYHQTGVRHIRRDPLPSRGRKTSLSKTSNPSSSPNQVLSPPSPTIPASPTSPILTVKLTCSSYSQGSSESVLSCTSPDANSSREHSSVPTSSSSNLSSVSSAAKEDSEVNKLAKPISSSILDESSKQAECTNPVKNPSCPFKDKTSPSQPIEDQQSAEKISESSRSSGSKEKQPCIKDSSSNLPRVTASSSSTKDKSPSQSPDDEPPSGDELSKNEPNLKSSGLALWDKNAKRTFISKNNLICVSSYKPVVSLVKCDSVKSDLLAQHKGQVNSSCPKSPPKVPKEQLSEQVVPKKSPKDQDLEDKPCTNQDLPIEQYKVKPNTDSIAVSAQDPKSCDSTRVKPECSADKVEKGSKPSILTEDSKKSHVNLPETENPSCRGPSLVRSLKASSSALAPIRCAPPQQETNGTPCKLPLTTLNNGLVRPPHPALSNLPDIKQGVPDLIAKENKFRTSNPKLILLADPSNGAAKETSFPCPSNTKAVDKSAISTSSLELDPISSERTLKTCPSSISSISLKVIDNENKCNIVQQNISRKTSASSRADDKLSSSNKISFFAPSDTSGHISDIISGNSELSCKPLQSSDSSLAVSTNNSPKIESASLDTSSQSPTNSVTIFSVSSVIESSKVKATSSSVSPVLSTKSQEPKGSVGPLVNSSNNSNNFASGLSQSLAVAGKPQSLAVVGLSQPRAVTITATSGPAPQGASRVASPPSVSITAVVRSPGSQHAQDPIQGQDGSQGPQAQLFPHSLCVQASSSSSGLPLTRMDQCDGSSDSGVSVTERSVSRSSVLSDDRASSAEVKPNTPTPAPILAPNHSKSSQQPLALDRKESVKVWRNPAVVSHSDYSVRHIHSLQHSMSQHFPGVPPHVPPSVGGHQGVSNHSSSHPPSHGPPLPPGLPYPGHPAAPHHPLHLPLQLYPQLQLPVPAAAAAAAFGLLPRHTEDFSYLEQQAREQQQQHNSDRLQRERREAEAAREKAAKMDRERQRKERDRRDREERARRECPEKEIQLVDQHFAESFRIASQRLGREKPQHNLHMTSDPPASAYYAQGLASARQQASPTTTCLPISHHSLITHQSPSTGAYQHHSQKGAHWTQAPGLSVKMDTRDHRQPNLSLPQHGEGLRKVKEPEQLVRDSIYKAFRNEDPESHLKVHNPPPAHTKHLPPEKNISSSITTYSQYLGKELKHSQERNAYNLLQEKTSVIVKPELQYEKVPAHSVSPKQRIPERSSPYSNAITGPNPYKPYEPSPSPHRGSTPTHQSSHPSSPINVELPKARPPQSSPLPAPPAHMYHPGTKTPVTIPYQSNIVPASIAVNHQHTNALASKSKVISSPSVQMYGKPGITSGTPVCKVETRPSQQMPLAHKPPAVTHGPPPAHSASRNIESRLPTAHEPRLIHNRSPFDARMYSNSGAVNPKSLETSLSSHHLQRGTPPISSHISLSSSHPAQTQPLDLGTRDDVSSPNRRRSQTPTPQEAKKPRLDNLVNSQPLLSRVSEPSPLYSPAATTIISVENTAALSKLKRVSSPVQQNISISHTQQQLPHHLHQHHPPTAQQQHAVSLVTTSIGSSISSNSSTTTSSSISSNNVIMTTTITTTTTSTSTTINSKPSSAQPTPTTTPPSQREENNSPTAPLPTRVVEPEKSSSPGPSGGGYVHKLKKMWVQRHESGADPLGSSVNNLPTRATTPPTVSNPVSSIANTKPAQVLPTTVKQEVKNFPRKPVKPSPIPNGHVEDSKDGDSTSTDSDDSIKHKAKKTKIEQNRLKRTKKSSDSNSDSEKESDGSEDSLKKRERVQKTDSKAFRKRGRKPKMKAMEKDREDNSKMKKTKDDPLPNDPLQKPPISHLKKTGESFLQDRACYEVAPKLPKCRECRWTANQRNKKMPNIFCRFYAFRRLRYTKNGQLAVAGFSDPVKDAFGEDLRLWVPDPNSPAHDLDKEKSMFLLTHVGDQFCDLVQQENEAMALHIGEETTVAWKRVVQGVREMCDVCETTLFNIHWACSKCGFVVCIDCYKGRKEGTVKVWDLEEGAKERDKYSWLLCASRLPHEQDKLMLTQIIAGNALKELGKKIHEVRYKWGIPMYCGCPEANRYKDKEQEDKKLNGINKDLMKNIKKEGKSGDLVNGSVKTEKGENINNGKEEDMSNSPLDFFADVALSNDKRESESSNSESDSDSDEKGQSSTLRELLVRPNAKSGSSVEDGANSQGKVKEPSKKKVKHDTLDDVISCVIDRGDDKDNKKDLMKVELKHFIRKYNYNRKGREPLPIRIMTKTESRLLYPNVPHSWLCDGKLLRLNDPFNKENIKVYQDQWKRGQPVIVSGTGHSLNGDLWKPNSFSRDFGEIKNNLINCLTDNIVPNQPMKKFWDGFENYSKRLKDEKGQPMVLKLKDWPPGDDFAEVLPKRFEDLMKVLPMGEYTRRNGSLNLAGRLPECFVRPDLGPKMYIAYGSASYPNKASTNLHLDISDAANVMCYVGIPKDVSAEDCMRDSLKAIFDAGCDVLTRQRVREKDEIPGALWHIYHARDADKIRDLLNKVAIERGKKLEPYHDPIHDQSWYLDGVLRERLYKEYGVEGYAIVQCMGDAVFVPAGAPHQVRNLHNCIKVAEDFVSPENVSHCFHLTQEFRHLSDTHTNHEDKLQIKNIIYHAMKDSIAYLMAAEQNTEEVKREPESS